MLLSETEVQVRGKSEVSPGANLRTQVCLLCLVSSISNWVTSCRHALYLEPCPAIKCHLSQLSTCSGTRYLVDDNCVKLQFSSTLQVSYSYSLVLYEGVGLFQIKSLSLKSASLVSHPITGAGICIESVHYNVLIAPESGLG